MVPGDGSGFVVDPLGWGIWDLMDGGVAFGLLALVIVLVALLAQRWVLARKELVHRVAELSTIEQVGRRIAEAQLDVDEICTLMYEWAGQVTDATIFHLGLFKGDEYTLKLLVREGEAVPPQTFRMTPGVGLVNWQRESKQPILVRDLPQELESLPVRPIYISDEPPRSALYVPLIAGEEVIGTMSVQSFRRKAYGDSELRVLSAMGNQAALAIQKAQLFAQERSRVRQLETIGEVSRQLTTALELGELFERVVRLVRDNFGYYHVGIYTVDRDRESITFRASASAGGQEVAPEIEWGEGLTGWVAAHKQAVIVNDVENEPRYRCLVALEETQSELTAPLLLDGELVGLLDVQSDERNAFGPDDLFILETLGSQIAAAIHGARLYEAERQQAWLSTALLQVADAMGQVSDMDAVLTSIVRLTPILAGVDRCAILLWDAEAEMFAPTQTYGLSPELREAFEATVYPEGFMPALDLVRWDKSPLHINVDRDRGLIPQSLVETFNIQEMVLLPLLAQGELLGVMMVDYAGKPHHFDERLVSMLVGIANQAAMVIQSARLVEAQRQEAYVSMALLQVAEAANQSTDLEETLATVVRITPMLIGVETCAIFLRDREMATFGPFQQYGLKGERRSAFWQLRLKEGEPVVRELAEGQPFVDVRDLATPSQLAQALGRDSLLVLPLTAKGDVVGMMAVDYAGSSQRFTQRWMNILTGIAGQAAIAIEDDRLLREAAEQERMKQELEVAQRIQASFLPDCCPLFAGWELAAVWRSARQVSGDFYDFIPLPPKGIGEEEQAGRLGLVIADVAGKGVPAALFMALSRTLVRTMVIDGRPPAVAIARANDLIQADARSGIFVTLFYTILQPDSGEITYVNAGHMPPVLARAADDATALLRVPGVALGILEGIPFEEHTAWLDPGDVLVLYTDGVTEASNLKQQMFGLDRLREVVMAHRHRSAEELAAAITEAVAVFAGDAPQFDDFSLLVAKRRGHG